MSDSEIHESECVFIHYPFFSAVGEVKKSEKDVDDIKEIKAY